MTSQDFAGECKCESNRHRHRATTSLVTGRPQAPSPGDHKGRPYYATASQAGAYMVAKERFFPSPGNFTLI